MRIQADQKHSLLVGFACKEEHPSDALPPKPFKWYHRREGTHVDPTLQQVIAQTDCSQRTPYAAHRAVITSTACHQLLFPSIWSSAWCPGWQCPAGATAALQRKSCPAAITGSCLSSHTLGLPFPRSQEDCFRQPGGLESLPPGLTMNCFLTAFFSLQRLIFQCLISHRPFKHSVLPKKNPNNCIGLPWALKWTLVLHLFVYSLCCSPDGFYNN